MFHFSLTPHLDIKEWAIVTLRNLCENNQENQEVIASLKTQGVLEGEELERLGLQAKLEANGKVTISKK
jgi:ataxin-10